MILLLSDHRWRTQNDTSGRPDKIKLYDGELGISQVWLHRSFGQGSLTRGDSRMQSTRYPVHPGWLSADVLPARGSGAPLLPLVRFQTTWLRSSFARWSTYAAFMRATNRDERPYLELAESLKKKGQAKEEQARVAKKKRA